MKRLLLLSIVIAAQQYAAEPNEPVKKSVESLRIHKVYDSRNKTVVPFTAQKPENAPIAQTSKTVTPKIVTLNVVSAEAAFIIAKVEAVAQSEKADKKEYTRKEIQQTQNACFRALKRTASACDRAALANAYAKIHPN